MRVVNEILLKILNQLKNNNVLNRFLNLKKLVKNQRKFIYIVEYTRLINDKERNFK